MKGFESMPIQKRELKESEAPELGEEIEEMLKAEEQAKQSPEEQIKNFFSSEIWQAWEAVKSSQIESYKEPAREKVINKLNELEEKIGDNPKLQKAIDIIRKEIGAPTGHA